MNNKILNYVDAIYSFCLKRLSNRQDAEDLAQEILLHIIISMKKQNIENLDAYIWRIAHNRYARKIQDKNKYPITYFGNDNLYDLEINPHMNSSIMDYKNAPLTFPSAEQEIIKNEESHDVFLALHTLSSIYRNILVDYYVQEYDISKIASSYGLSKETVKWRLHVGRSKLKERIFYMNKNYKKIEMQIMCNGSFDPLQYLSNQLYKAIALACYEKPMTIEEISVYTGIPTLYLEEALEFMIYGDAIEQTGNKYSTNFIIVDTHDHEKIIKELQPFISQFITSTFKIIHAQWDKIADLIFYSKQFDSRDLSYWLLPLAVRIANEKTKNITEEFFVPPFPLRKDGGYGYFIVTKGTDDLNESFSGENQYHYKNSENHTGAYTSYFWYGDLYDSCLNEALKKFDNSCSINRETGECIPKTEDDLINLLKNNLIYKSDSNYYSTIPILSKSQYEKIKELLSLDNDELVHLLLEMKKIIRKHFKQFTPKRLHEQIIGNLDCYGILGNLIKNAREEGLLIAPDSDKTFTKNIIYVYNDIPSSF